MALIRRIRSFLMEPALRAVEVDSSDLSVIHRKVLLRKKILRELFDSFYRECRAADERYLDGSGARIELGSGSSVMKGSYPDVITSDVKRLPFVDLVLDAQQMPLRDASVRAFYAINVFHHLPDSRAFFRELLRVLIPGGGVVMVEPYFGPVARLLFPHLHATERYDLDASTWETSAQTGPMSNANQALSYIVFRRDLDTFQREFPRLEIVFQRPHTHLWYLTSGGVNFRQLVPDSAVALIKALETAARPLNRWLALQHTIVLRKSADSSAP